MKQKHEAKMKTNCTWLLEGPKIVKETEKAIQLNVAIGDERRTNVWFPKSQIDIRGEEIWATAWIMEQKDREVCWMNEAGIAAAWYPDGKFEIHADVVVSLN